MTPNETNIAQQVELAEFIERLDDRWREEGIDMSESEQLEYIEAASKLAALVLQQQGYLIP